MAKQTRLGDLERAVMDHLWSVPHPQTVRQVHEALSEQRDLAYTTVMTTLSRLYTKRALSRSLRGRAFVYELIGDSSRARSSITAHQMRMLLDAGADRASVLSRFVETLDGETEQLLRRLLTDEPTGRER